MDKKTLAAIPSLDPAALHAAIQAQMARRIRGLDTSACGEAPIMAAMAAAKAMGATGGRVVSYANSGDLPIGERERVVGYGAVVLGSGLAPAKEAAPPASAVGKTLTPADKKALLALARETISRYLTTQMVPLPRGFSPAAMEQRGVFVTLKKHGNLRGCIGRMIPDRPLATLVGMMALQAAFEDPRFRPVTLEEVPKLEIEISVLTPMTAGLRSRGDRGRPGRRPLPEGEILGGLPPPGRTRTGVGARRDALQPLPEGGTPGGRLAGRGGVFLHLPGGGVR